jgi:hypothetical protein
MTGELTTKDCSAAILGCFPNRSSVGDGLRGVERNFWFCPKHKSVTVSTGFGYVGVDKINSRNAGDYRQKT